MDEDENTQSASLQGLAALTADEFQLLISSGGTMNIKQMNAKLGGTYVTAELIAALEIDFRKERGATHIAAEDFHLLTARFAAHIMRAGRPSLQCSA